MAEAQGLEASGRHRESSCGAYRHCAVLPYLAASPPPLSREGGILAVSVERARSRARAWDVAAMCNGILGGLVSITAGCATVRPHLRLEHARRRSDDYGGRADTPESSKLASLGCCMPLPHRSTLLPELTPKPHSHTECRWPRGRRC